MTYDDEIRNMQSKLSNMSYNNMKGIGYGLVAIAWAIAKIADKLGERK